MPKVAWIMGSDSDLPALTKGIKLLKDFGVDVEAAVMSAHRTPDIAAAFAASARDEGFEVIIAAAGKAAHLAGVIAAYTTLPVIGIPMKSSALEGLDALLSTVQMPPGVPVATVAIDGAENAAILAVQILAVKYDELADKLKKYKGNMAKGVMAKDAKVKQEVSNL